jgi:purine-nucleoside phosphorylase
MLPLNDKPLTAAVQAVGQRCAHRPAVGIILGSGLGGLADQLTDPVAVPYAEIPGLVCTTAAGHRGQLILGTFAEKTVVVMDGRIHRYEGYNDDQITFAVRLMAALGARRLIVTNAAGGLNPNLHVGDIVVIRDHIDLAKSQSQSLLACRRDLPHDVGGGVDIGGESVKQRIPTRSSSELYNRSLCEVALQAARKSDFHATLGTYLATLGPTYETRAEYRMMRFFGADVVGMSTAPEVRAGYTLGMQVLGLSLVSNVAQPDWPQNTNHEEVLAAGRAAAAKLQKIVAAATHFAPDPRELG